MNTRGIKFVAVLLLAAAIAALVGAFIASDRAARVQGPGALVVGIDREVWIGVDDALWRVSPDGQLRARIGIATTGLPGPPANLVRHPGGAIVATVRDDPTLYFLDAAQARVTRRVLPRWPAELVRHGGRAINLAFHPDGRVAIATGGGHAVALFDADGAFIARSAPDTYKFSNGLWWQGDALWTTDTNRFRLKRLDGTTLELREEQALRADPAGTYLGPARAHPAADGATRAALIRYRAGMIEGRIVAIGGEVREAGFETAASMEPRDLAWLGDELLASDGASLSVLRWSAERAAQGTFGDAELRGLWSALLDHRAALQRRYRLGLAVAIGTFAVAFALAVWAEWRGRTATLRQSPIDLARLGTRRVTQGELLLLALRATGWLLLVAPLLAPLAYRPVLDWLRAVGGLPLLLAVPLVLTTLMLASVVYAMRRLKRLARSPEYEPMFNAVAMRKLTRSSALGLALRDGEQALETFTWQQPTLHWVVLTNERLLVFVATLFDARLKTQLALSDIAAASTTRGALKPGKASFTALLWRWSPAGWLEILPCDGKAMAGAVPAATVAERVAAYLQRHHGISASSPRGPASAIAAGGPSAARAAFASALVPGLGQWMQRRRASALSMFVPWAIAATAVFIPIAWALQGPRFEVTRGTIALAVAVALTIHALAAWDAWRMGRRGPA